MTFEDLILHMLVHFMLYMLHVYFILHIAYYAFHIYLSCLQYFVLHRTFHIPYSIYVFYQVPASPRSPWGVAASPSFKSLLSYAENPPQVCMFVYMLYVCVCVCMYICVYMYVCMYVYVSIWMYICTYH